MKIETEFESGYDADVVARNKVAAKEVVALIGTLQKAYVAIEKSGHGMAAVKAIENGQKAIKKGKSFLNKNSHLKVCAYTGNETTTVSDLIATFARFESLGAGFGASRILSSMISFLQKAQGYDFDTKLIKLDRNYA